MSRENSYLSWIPPVYLYRIAFAGGILTGMAIGGAVYCTAPGGEIVKKIDNVISPKPIRLGSAEYWLTVKNYPGE
jgi:hypothetical protein